MKDIRIVLERGAVHAGDGNGRFILLVDGARSGMWDSEVQAKASARRFMHSTDKIKWVPFGGGIKAVRR